MSRIGSVFRAVVWLAVAAGVMSSCGDDGPSGSTSGTPSHTVTPTASVTQTPGPATATPDLSVLDALLAGIPGDLAYVRDEGHRLVIASDGGTTTTVVYDAGPEAWISFPEWSADADALAFTVMSGAGVFRALAVQRDGEILFDIAEAALPRWSPDGSTVSIFLDVRPTAFSTSATPAILDVGSKESREIGPSGELTDSPRWRPDGGALAMTVGAGLRRDLFLVDSLTLERTQLATDVLGAFWSPSGEQLAVWSQEQHLLIVDSTTGETLASFGPFAIICGNSDPINLRDQLDWVNSSIGFAVPCPPSLDEMGLWVLDDPLLGDPRQIPLTHAMGATSISPDGQWIASSVAFPLIFAIESPFLPPRMMVLARLDGSSVQTIEGASYPQWAPIASATE